MNPATGAWGDYLITRPVNLQLPTSNSQGNRALRAEAERLGVEREPTPSGYRRPKPVVHPVGGARARRTAGADDEIGIGIHIAAFDVDHTRLADEGLAIAQQELDAVVAGLHRELENAGRIGGRAVAF